MTNTVELVCPKGVQKSPKMESTTVSFSSNPLPTKKTRFRWTKGKSSVLNKEEIMCVCVVWCVCVCVFGGGMYFRCIEFKGNWKTVTFPNILFPAPRLESGI